MAVLGQFNPAFKPQPAYLLMLLVFLGNFYVGGPPFPPVSLSLLWSVSVEEQFYLMWPQVMRRASVRGIRIAGLAMFAASTLAPSAALIVGHFTPDVWQNTFFRLHSFAVGILIGTMPAGFAPRLASRFGLIAAGVTLWFLASFYGFASPEMGALAQTLSYPAIALGAGALLLAALGSGALYPRFAANRALVYLGKISYGLYVYHVFAMTLAEMYAPGLLRPLGRRWPGVVLPMWSPILIVLSAVLTLSFAMASYRWLESPFLRFKNRYTVVPSRPV